MIIDKDGNITIITQEKASVTELVKKLDVVYNRYKNDNIIVSLTSLQSITLQDVIEFLQISNTHRKSKHSFVIVSDKVNLDEMPDEILVVPTLQEAYDIIEMEEMERDLGF
ncbi:MAG: ribonuclease Z [Xanthomarina sp.]|uniref:ribonuclease Z n=1 Tax=Xanthomarina sp. TaxID=1931211 RepID=UPI000C68AB4F|nr:ribonuclease Z [Xanthomarina sp.]MBF62852.1 ribonuclease Z [Xanthomarina sp.]HAB27496.1 ribonuclease Z [Xanthomarina gelatinilytica]|tara:strand:- start:124 stop:456 length:333 start_codon:yes stop_codon:yes gene_type:complete